MSATKFLIGRKVIQICEHILNGFSVLTALCNDGTMWSYSYNPSTWKFDWKQIESVPQDIIKEEYTQGALE